MIAAVALAAFVATVPPADDPMAPYVDAAEAAFQEAVGAPLIEVQCDVDPIDLEADCFGYQDVRTLIRGETPIGPDGGYRFAAGDPDELRSGNLAAETTLGATVRECLALPADADDFDGLIFDDDDFELLDGGHSLMIARTDAFSCVASRIGLPQWLIGFIRNTDVSVPTTMTFGNFTVTWVDRDGLEVAISDTEVAPD
jgi:hypothetical protein